jgi:hypothetical protein
MTNEPLKGGFFMGSYYELCYLCARDDNDHAFWIVGT